LYAPVFLIQIGAGMLLPVLPLALLANGLAYQSLTAVLAATGFGALLSQIPIGRLLNRYSENQVMTACVALTAVSVVLLGFVGTVVGLMALRFTSGIGSTGWLLSRQTFITRTIESEVRGRAMSLFGGLNRVAFLVGPLLGGFVAEQFGFRQAFIIAAVFTASGAAPLLMVPRLPAIADGEPTHPGRQRVETAHPLAVFATHRRILLPAGAAQICIIAVRYGRFIILPLIGESIGLDIAQIGILVAIGSASDIVLFPAAGYLMDRYGRLAAIVPSFSLLGVGLLLLAGASSHGAIMIAAAVIGIGNGLGSGTMMTLSSDLAPPDSPGEFLAALGTIREIGRILGPLGVGFLADWAGLGTAAFAMALVAFLGVAIMIFGVGETKRTDISKGAGESVQIGRP
jgi:MFS family permease